MIHRFRLNSTVVAAGVVGALLLSLSRPASADDRKSPLAGQPAVRHRLLLVRHRFELTPAFESSVNADFKHTVSGGLKAEFHLSDMWSIGAVGLFGTSFNTNLTNKIIQTLPTMAPTGDPTPNKAEWEQHLDSIPLHGAAYIGLTPWYGKLAAFGKFFVNFDFYFTGGVSFAQLKNTCCNFGTDSAGNMIKVDTHPGTVSGKSLPDNDPRNDPALNSGTQLGLFLGGGIHLFLSQAVAMDLTVRDYAFSDNPSGLDFNADLAVTSADNRFLNHLFMGVGVSVFFPTTAKRTP